MRDRARVRQAGGDPLALGQQRQAVGQERRRLHLSLRVRRRGGARHDGGGEGPDLPRPCRRPAAQHGLRGGSLGHHARGRRADGHEAQPGEDGRDLCRGQEARHPSGGRRRLRLRLDPAGHQCPRPQALRRPVRLLADGRHRLRHALGRRADAHGRRAGAGARGLPRRPAPGRRQPLGGYRDHGRPEPVRHDHEGRRDLQGSTDIRP